MEWISVEDRLPELYQYIIAYNKPDNIFDILRMEKCCDNYDCERRLTISFEDLCNYTTKGNCSNRIEKNRFFSDNSYCEIIDEDNITHWMPLPEPPEETNGC